MDKYLVEINGKEIGQMVEIDSYSTSLDPVYGDSVTTMDGVEHVAIIRYRGTVKFALNPRTDASTAEICALLLESPLQVRYHCLQRNTEVLARMKINSLSAQYLGRVRYGGRKWNEIPAITLKEL